jgi:hypothetical protein
MIMFDRKQGGGHSPALREWLVAVGWSLAFLVLTALQQLGEFGSLSGDWGALLQSMGIRFRDTPLGGEVLRFLGALLLVHLLFAAVCWLLFRLVLRAVPQWQVRRWRVLLAVLGVVSFWVLLANATLFPWSLTGFQAEWLAAAGPGGLQLFDVVTTLLAALVVHLAFRAARTVALLRRHGSRLALYGVLLAAVFLAVPPLLGEARGSASFEQPHLILIGVDSLRNDAVGEGRGVGVTPHIDAFLRDGAHRFLHATTPLARTYPSWVATLTGRYPRHTGAREDLAARRALQPFETLADTARRAGYHTVWAMDEMRFSNIDESYGFDQRVTPTIGVADFLLGKANDFPVTNLIANSGLGRLLFPATYGNRAAAHVYRPRTFVDWIDREVQPAGPTLLAVHLTLPHHPFHWAAASERAFSRDTDSAYRYLNCVIAADGQFGGILHALERKGMLDNAIVVLLSDHGEALGVPGADSLLQGREVLELLDGHRIFLMGHGSSVFSPNQFATVLAVRGFGRAELPPPRSHSEAVSMVDIAPTLADLASLPTPPAYDGKSLRPLLFADAAASAPLADRVFFSETGFRTPLLDAEHIDEAGIMGSAAPFFVMDPKTARLEVRAELLPRLVADKERAAFSRDWFLGAMPTPGGPQSHIYLFAGRRGESPRRVSTQPGDSDPELRRLWVALRAHYGEELPDLPAAANPPMTADRR